VDDEDKQKLIKDIFASDSRILRAYDIKEQLKVLMSILPNIGEICARLQDPKIANWLLIPDVENSLKTMAQQYAPETVAICALAGSRFSYFSIGLDYKSAIDSKIR
jgi:DNA polymerase theta